MKSLFQITLLRVLPVMPNCFEEQKKTARSTMHTGTSVRNEVCSESKCGSPATDKENRESPEEVCLRIPMLKAVWLFVLSTKSPYAPAAIYNSICLIWLSEKTRRIRETNYLRCERPSVGEAHRPDYVYRSIGRREVRIEARPGSGNSCASA